MADDFEFPPTTTGMWRDLDREGRWRWLDLALKRHFELAKQDRLPARSPGRTVVLDGADFDDLSGFYCAIGEAVNGPGGYFGRFELGFYDCLFGGFGLEPPCRIVWERADRSQAVLGAAGLAESLRLILDWMDEQSDLVDERAATAERLDAALRGEGSLFDDLVAIIRSASKPRTDGPPEIELVLKGIDLN